MFVETQSNPAHHSLQTVHYRNYIFAILTEENTVNLKTIFTCQNYHCFSQMQLQAIFRTILRRKQNDTKNLSADENSPQVPEIKQGKR